MTARRTDRTGQPTLRRGRAPRSAGHGFDLLHTRHARDLTRQAYLLCGCPRLAERAVAHAFRAAWQRWPDVVADPDPAAWVRAAAHDHVLSPWHRLVPGRCRPVPHPGPAADRALRDGLLALPASYRRALLLHHGLGLGTVRTAVECEASVEAVRGRLRHGLAALTERVPELYTAHPALRPALVSRRLRAMSAALPVRAGTPEAAREHAFRRRVRAGATAAVVVTAVLVVSLAPPEQAAPRQRLPPAAPAAPVQGGAGR
jgi:DNA-directed RNA polymerase specialized sigma24 family protein